MCCLSSVHPFSGVEACAGSVQQDLSAAIEAMLRSAMSLVQAHAAREKGSSPVAAAVGAPRCASAAAVDMVLLLTWLMLLPTWLMLTCCVAGCSACGGLVALVCRACVVDLWAAVDLFLTFPFCRPVVNLLFETSLFPQACC